MTTSAVNIKIYWLPISQGGKKMLPFKNKYYPITAPLPDKSGKLISWSLVISIYHNEQSNTNERMSLGDAYFLMEHAPNFLLKKGFTTHIYEGPKQVATIEVI